MTDVKFNPANDEAAKEYASLTRSRLCVDCKKLGDTKPATRLCQELGKDGNRHTVPRCTFHWKNPLSANYAAAAQP